MNTKNKYSAATIASLAVGRDGVSFTSAKTERTNPSPIARFGASVGIGIALLSGTSGATGQTWDNTRSNAYVAAGLADQCTAYGLGRYRTLNGNWLTFTNPQGKKVYPHGGLMVGYADETATSYRDSTPVRGALVSWSGGIYGHVANIESLTFKSGKLDSVKISEQNWPLGTKPGYKTLSAKELTKRGSYTLAGFLNPNRPPSIGTIQVTKSGTTGEVRFPVLDEDGRKLRILFALTDTNGTVLTSGNADVSSNVTVNVRGVRGFRVGQTYRWHVWAWDFRDLRGTNSTSFTW